MRRQNFISYFLCALFLVYGTSASARYVTSDPIGLEGGLNTYTYVDNNPMTFVDPEGLANRSVNGFCSSGMWNACGGGGGGTGGGRGGFGGTGTKALKLQPVRGPSGTVSTQKYLEKRWDKGTFGTTKKSIEYHVGKHGKGLSPVTYTQRAQQCFNNPAADKSTVKDLLGRDALRVTSKEGTGLFTPQGKVIWFHPR